MRVPTLVCRRFLRRFRQTSTVPHATPSHHGGAVLRLEKNLVHTNRVRIGLVKTALICSVCGSVLMLCVGTCIDTYTMSRSEIYCHTCNASTWYLKISSNCSCYTWVAMTQASREVSSTGAATGGAIQAALFVALKLFEVSSPAGK